MRPLQYHRKYHGGAVVPVSTSYDADISAIRDRIRDLAASLAIWSARSEPDAHALCCASNAVDAIDAMLRELYVLRDRPILPAV
jgi:hypothetical protein